MLKKKQKKSNKTHPFTSISLFFYDHIRITLFVWLALIVAGFSAYGFLLNREGFPPVQLPYGIASGTYFVDDAQKVDRDIARPVSKALDDVDSITKVDTVAGANFFSIVASFDETITSSEEATRILESEIEKANVLPKEARTEYLAIDPALYLNKYDILVSVYDTGNLTNQELESKAKQVANKIGRDDGIETAKVESLYSENINPATGQVESRQSNFSRISLRDGDGLKTYQAVTVGVVASDALDVIEVSEVVNNAVDEINTDESFSDVGVEISADFAPSIETQISSLQENMITALLAVVFVCLILITWRVSAIIGLIILSVMATTFFVMFLAGITINTISLFALVLVLGLFVDDATIIAEAIDAARGKNKKPREVVKEAINKVAPASFAGSLTTILVFVPLLFIGGILGEFIQILPITIIIALLSSYVLSIALVPFLARFILLRTPKNNKTNPVAIMEARASLWLAKLPLLLRRHKVKGSLVAVSLFSVSLVLFFASGYYAQKLSFNIFPPSKDSDELIVQLTFSPGLTIGEAEEVASDVDETLESVLAENMQNASYYDANERSATIQLDLIPFTEREVTSVELIEKLNTEFEKSEVVKVQISQLDAGPPAEEFPFKVQIYGENQKAAFAVAQAIEGNLNGATVERQNSTTAQVVATDINVDGTIKRTDGDKYIEVRAGFDADDTTSLVTATQERIENEFTQDELEKLGLKDGRLGFDFGQESENQESFSSLGYVGLAALATIILLLAIQFRSLLQPVLIFMAIPFSLFGVMFGLYITDNPISFFVMVGFFGLMGIAVNNTIMLTDYANQEREKGSPLIESISTAVHQRFRPLLATSATTVVALLPLALSDPFWEPLAFTILFGLLSSTFLVIVSFPYYYLFLEGSKKRFMSVFKRIVLRKS